MKDDSSSLYSRAYSEAKARLDKIQELALSRQMKQDSSSVSEAENHSASSNQFDYDYVKVSSINGLPLSSVDVETYFANLGSISWCIQVTRDAVAFEFTDKGLNTAVLPYGHKIANLIVKLQGMKNGI